MIASLRRTTARQWKGCPQGQPFSHPWEYVRRVWSRRKQPWKKVFDTADCRTEGHLSPMTAKP